MAKEKKIYKDIKVTKKFTKEYNKLIIKKERAFKKGDISSNLRVLVGDQTALIISETQVLNNEISLLSQKKKVGTVQKELTSLLEDGNKIASLMVNLTSEIKKQENIIVNDEKVDIKIKQLKGSLSKERTHLRKIAKLSREEEALEKEIEKSEEKIGRVAVPSMILIVGGILFLLIGRKTLGFLSLTLGLAIYFFYHFC